MQWNYRKLGEYIELVCHYNTELNYGESDIRGVSNNKEIIKTKANNKVRAFDNFYIVAPNDFIYNSRTSRMGDKVGLGYNDSDKTFITSFNNTVFRVKNEELLPMYLFMWFNRPEFDRYARFHSWGSSTELFPWDEMCEVKLPVPTIEKQREIVAEYTIVKDRIDLNNQLIKKLEETAQAIYKQWFVDFEFPFDFAQGKPNKNGRPYKSSGGKMVWNEELDKEIPEGWDMKPISEVGNLKAGGDKPNDFSEMKTSNFQIPIYSNGINNDGLYGYTNKYNYPKNSITISARGTIGFCVLRRVDFDAIVRLLVLIPKYSYSAIYLWQTIKEINFDNSGSVQNQLTIPQVNGISILCPEKEVLRQYDSNLDLVYRSINLQKKENHKLSELKELLLSKMATIEN